MKLLNFCRRSYPRYQSHRLVLRFAVPVDQVRSLRSSLVTAFVATMNRSDFCASRPDLPHHVVVSGRRAPTPAGADLISYTLHPRMHSMPADPAVAMTGVTVISSLSRLRRVCLPPVLATFALV